MPLAKTFTEISFLSPQIWNQPVFDTLKQLRESDPVHWSEADKLWLVSCYEDVEAISKNQTLFTSAEGVRPNTAAQLGLIDEGEPRHRNLRKLLNRGFTPRMVKALEPAFRDMVNETLDKVADKGQCDFVTDIAVPLPLLVIAEMLGIRPEDRENFHRWSDDMMGGDGAAPGSEAFQKATLAAGQYAAYVSDIIADRRENPRQDMISILVGAKLEGDRDGEDFIQLSDGEIIQYSIILMVAGNETTRNALSGGMELLINNPDQRQKLLDEPGLIPSAVEEMVRLVSPVQSFSRTVTEDTELRGKQLKKGDKVLLLYPSANRDGARFENPDQFDVTRNPAHLGFGIGSHFCLGANLARMELRVAFNEILRRLPDMEFSDGGPELGPSALVRNCKHMNVQFTPETPAV